MRISLLFLLITAFAINLNAQAPSNDNCQTATNLGALPYCFNDILTNVNATESGGGNPSCFNGGTSQRDVWFSFEAAFEDVSLILEGDNDGTNGSITNPQVIVYRGTCDGLSQVACLSSENGAQNLALEIPNLAIGQTYFIQINDYSLTAAPNSGDFRLCLDRLEDAFILDRNSGSNACFGTLFDSGGPNGQYDVDEDFEFVINPAQQGCIEIEMVDFQIEAFDTFMDVGDVLQFFDGIGRDGEILAQVSSVPNGTPFVIQVDGPVTVVFRSDEFVNFDGFELKWRCLGTACDGSSLANPTEVASLPYTGSFSTCDGKASLGETACTADLFLFGPDYVFEYNSPGGICTEIAVDAELEETGVLVLDGLPTDPNTRCVSQSVNGFVVSADMQEAGTYYIVVANAQGCGDFDIQIRETECIPTPSLENALCNSLNGCDINNGEPVEFNFIDGFEDIVLEERLNSGCWENNGIEPDFYWFTIQAQADGDFGFLASGTDGVSDLDFNVWGPFDPEVVCTNNEAVINFISNNQPIRSSWSSASPVTGLTRVNPLTGEEVEDSFDCDIQEPGSDGDGFVLPIEAKQGEVYVVLLNDWGNEILNAAVTIDWGPSDMEVIQAITPTFELGDTSICPGEVAQLELAPGLRNIQWTGDTESLSCTDCPNPTATPSETTTYTVDVDAICYNATIEVEVRIFQLNDLADLRVCTGETVEIVAGVDFKGDATYSWTIPDGLTASCMDCPNPQITAEAAGTYEVRVDLDAPDCPSSATFTIEVLPEAAPVYEVIDDLTACEEDELTLGVDLNENNTFEWYTLEGGSRQVFSNEAAPVVILAESATYYVDINNGICPETSMDSVKVTVIKKPVLDVANDTTVCQSQPLLLGRTMLEEGVTYSWEGPDNITPNDDPNLTIINPESSGNYILMGDREGCVADTSVNVEIIPISIDIPLDDTTFVCLEDEITVRANIQPVGAEFFWTSNVAPEDTLRVDTFNITPTDSIIYYGTVLNMGCRKDDSVLVVVDSLPDFLNILPADTTVCNSIPVVLRTPAYEPAEFPDIEHKWLPMEGQETPDSLFNLVAVPSDTIKYFRITTNNACADTTSAVINVVIPPPITITPADTTICAGDPVQLTIEVPEGKTLEKIEWMPADGLSCSDCLNPTASPTSTQAYSVMGEIDGCPVSAGAGINIANDIGFQFAGRALICPGDEVVLNEVDNPLVEYTWTASPDNGFGTVTDARPRVSPTETTTYSLVAIRTDVPSCAPFEAQVLIEVTTPGDPVLSADASEICENDLTFVNAEFESFPGENFLWTDNMGQLTEPSPRVSVAPRSTTTYTFTLDRPGACPDFSGDVTVIVREPAIIPVSVELSASDETICEGSQVNLSANVPNFNSTTDSIGWNIDGNPIGNGLEVSDSITQTTTYTFELLRRIRDGNSCQDEVFSGTITVNVLPIDSIERNDIQIFADNNVVCEGSQVNLSANIPGGFDPNTATAEWFLEDSNNTIIGEGLNASDNPTSPINTYRFEFSEQNVCTIESFSSSVDVFTDPLPQLPGDGTQQICEGEQAILTAPSGTGFRYEWTSTDPGFTGSTAQSISVSPTSTQVYTVAVTSGACPPETVSETVNVIEAVESIQVGASRTVIQAMDEDRAVTITGVVTPAPQLTLSDSAAVWTANDTTLIALDVLEFDDSPFVTTTYTLTYQSGAECGEPLSASVRVVVINIVIPNAFAPDGNNKTFNIIDIGGSVTEIVTFDIFNRFGQRVYNNENPGKEEGQGWDGTFNGTPQPSDVYGYYIEVLLEDGSIQSFKGDVTLVR